MSGAQENDNALNNTIDVCREHRKSRWKRALICGFTHKRLSAIIKRLFYALTRETSKIKQLCPITKTCCSLNCILRCILRCSDVVRYYFAAAMTSCLRHLRTLSKLCVHKAANECGLQYVMSLFQLLTQWVRMGNYIIIRRLQAIIYLDGPLGTSLAKLGLL